MPITRLRGSSKPDRNSLNEILTVAFYSWLLGIVCFGAGTTSTFASVMGQPTAIGQSGASLVVRASEPKDTAKLSHNELEERGIKLRVELEGIFAALSSSGKLNRENDISTAIAPYIAAGMTFDESEHVLRAAGFDVSPHSVVPEARDSNGPSDRYTVLASIRNFSKRFLGSVTVYVTLYPKSPGDYSEIKDVRAKIFVEVL